jgi:hypothetical protein
MMTTPTDQRPTERSSRCRSCAALIWWRVNDSGRRQPFDWVDGPTEVPHHATCPDRQQWRRA